MNKKIFSFNWTKAINSQNSYDWNISLKSHYETTIHWWKPKGDNGVPKGLVLEYHLIINQSLSNWYSRYRYILSRRYSSKIGSNKLSDSDLSDRK